MGDWGEDQFRGGNYLSWVRCPNCHENRWWREDAKVSISTRYQRLRLYCLCGYDVWVGGYVRPEVVALLAGTGNG